MKKIILSICILGLGLSLFAQQAAKEGEVVYEETMKFDFDKVDIPEQMKTMIPKERKSKQVLYFNEEASSYQATKEKAEENVPGQRRRGMRFMMMGGGNVNNKVYLNFKKNIKIEQKEFMTRMFLIKGEPTKDNWKLTPNQKMILNYPCQQAIQITKHDTISAWFTPVIPVPAGPSNYVNLPGLVLEVDINQGKRVIIAKSIDLKPIDKGLIAKPKKGKKVTKEEFRKIVEKKAKEMGAQQGGRRMIVRHR